MEGCFEMERGESSRCNSIKISQPLLPDGMQTRHPKSSGVRIRPIRLRPKPVCHCCLPSPGIIHAPTHHNASPNLQHYIRMPEPCNFTPRCNSKSPRSAHKSPFPPVTFAACTALNFCVQAWAGWIFFTVRSSSEAYPGTRML